MTQPLTALFVDCDSYFASVEQHLDPRLRGRQVGVAPVMAETSCCIAASYEAKAFGARTGMLLRDARKMPVMPLPVTGISRQSQAALVL